jgi:hypothetical protein
MAFSYLLLTVFMSYRNEIHEEGPMDRPGSRAGNVPGRIYDSPPNLRKRTATSPCLNTNVKERQGKKAVRSIKGNRPSELPML